MDQEQDNIAAETTQEVPESAPVAKNDTKPQQAKTPWIVTLMVIAMRIVVGGTFIFSGFVKAIDPWGTIYKFQEYALTLGWDHLAPYALFVAFAIAALEFTLGMQLAVGAFRRMAPIGTIAFLLVMTPLTYWLAKTNAVPDCGCFGDALILSNWATFWKNVLLLAGAIFLLILNRKVHGLYGPLVHWIVALLAIAFPLALSAYGYFIQPLLDFRPFKVGTTLSPTAEQAPDDYIFIYEHDGKEYQFPIDSLPDDDDPAWKFVDRRPKPHAVDSLSNVNAGKHTIAILDQGDDISNEVFIPYEKRLIFLFPELDSLKLSYAFALNELNEYAKQHGAQALAITSASDKDVLAWNDMTLAEYPIYEADDSDIKMLARGNPAVVFVDNGVIKWKRTISSVDPDRVHDPNINIATLSDDFKPWQSLSLLTTAYALAMIALLVLNRTHVVILSIFRRKKDEEPLKEPDQPETQSPDSENEEMK